MITIDSLSVRRDGRTLSDGVTMHLAEGAVHGFSGTDDAVWTALFDALFELVRPDAGGVTRFGRPLRRSETAYLERRIRFFDGLTVRDLLDFTARRHPGSDPETCIRLLGLPPDRQLTALPAAVQRKTALAATLMQRKPVLLLDEPFDGLDAESLESAQRLILRRQAEGATVLVASRLLPALEPVCDDIRLTDGGRIAAEYRRGEYARAGQELERLFALRYGVTTSGKIS